MFQWFKLDLQRDGVALIADQWYKSTFHYAAWNLSRFMRSGNGALAKDKRTY